MRFRGFLYGLFMKSCGQDFQVTHDSILRGIEKISVGRHCFVANGTFIMGNGEIIIEDEVMIGPNSVIIADNHTYSNGSFRYGKPKKGKIFLGKGSWIAANCTVQINSSLPQGSVLAANSFLNRSFSLSDSIYGGIPARYIKSLV